MATLDVRPILAAGGEPFQQIMAAVDRLDEGESLELLAPFEAVPLYAVLENRGFIHSTESLPCGNWKVTFTRA
jgi:uncharacterized protein (DUF2249 family)